MLTLKLKAGDVVMIGEDIRLVVKQDSTRGRLSLGIDAPREVEIARNPVTVLVAVQHNI